MMLGMLKDLGTKLVGVQARTRHGRQDVAEFLPQDVRDHQSLELRRRKPASNARGGCTPVGASVLV